MAVQFKVVKNRQTVESLKPGYPLFCKSIINRSRSSSVALGSSFNPASQMRP